MACRSFISEELECRLASWLLPWTPGNVGEHDFEWWEILREKGRESRVSAEKWERYRRKTFPNDSNFMEQKIRLLRTYERECDSPNVSSNWKMRYFEDVITNTFFFFGSRGHLPRASWFVLIFKHEKHFLTSSQIQWGLRVTHWRLCTPPARSWHCLFSHETTRLQTPPQSTASVKWLAETAKGGSRSIHFFCSERSGSCHLRRTYPGPRDAWVSFGHGGVV